MTPQQKLMDKFRQWCRDAKVYGNEIEVAQTAFLAGAVAAMEMHFEPRADWFAERTEEADTPFIVMHEPSQSHQDCAGAQNDHPTHDLGAEG